jgi:hypothetical protein
MIKVIPAHDSVDEPVLARMDQCKLTIVAREMPRNFESKWANQ